MIPVPEKNSCQFLLPLLALHVRWMAEPFLLQVHIGVVLSLARGVNFSVVALELQAYM